VAYGSGRVVINEVELNPPGDDNLYEVIEWVELYNTENEEIDIGGWVIKSTGARSKFVTIPKGTKIRSRGFYVPPDGYLREEWLDNYGETIVLLDGIGNEIDRVRLQSDIYDNDCTWCRYPDGGCKWQLMKPSKRRSVSGRFFEGSEEYEIDFDMSQSVSGQGFVNIAQYITGLRGNELSIREHGSGTYSNELGIEYNTEVNKKRDLIELDKANLSAIYENYSLLLPKNRSITYISRWTDTATATSSKDETSMQESYRYAVKIEGDSYMLLGRGGPSMAVESEFDGATSFRFVSPDFRSTEDYTGVFRVFDKISEDGSNRSVSLTEGKGLVRVDKQIKDEQKTYEHGTGTYAVDELIEVDAGYIAKDIQVTHTSTSFNFTPRTSINQSLSWREGISSSKSNLKGEHVGHMEEEFSDLERLEKVTVVKGLDEMNTNANFTGKARFRTILRDDAAGDWCCNSRFSSSICISGINFDAPGNDHYNLNGEWVKITNIGSESTVLTGWTLSDNENNHVYEFPSFILGPGSSVTVYTGPGIDTATALYVGSRRAIWDNDGDIAILRDVNGDLVDAVADDPDVEEDKLFYNLELYDEYEGTYEIRRNTSIKMIPKYDVPHLSIACRGRTDPKECLAVNYTITVLNDGNMILGPIYIRDNFPSGTEFVNASIEPSDLTPRYAEWSITTLRIGESATIDLRLKVTREIDKLTNRAVAESIYEKKSGQDIQEKKVRAYSTSDVMIDWEMCRLPNLSASMTAELDYSTPTIVDYKLIIQNLADYKMTVNVTDQLPEGMMFLNSTIEPSRI